MDSGESREPSLPPSVEPVAEIVEPPHEDEVAAPPSDYEEELVVDKSKLPSVITALNDMEAELEDYTMLQCVFENADEINWTLNSGPIPESTVVRV